MKIVTPPAKLELPRIQVVDQTRVTAVREFVELFNAAFNDPEALIIDLDRRVNSTAARIVQGSDRPTLEVVRWQALADNLGEVDHYKQMTVRESDGEMFIVVEQRVMDHVNFAADPFINLIMGHFRHR